MEKGTPASSLKAGSPDLRPQRASSLSCLPISAISPHCQQCLLKSKATASTSQSSCLSNPCARIASVGDHSQAGLSFTPPFFSKVLGFFLPHMLSFCLPLNLDRLYRFRESGTPLLRPENQVGKGHSPSVLRPDPTGLKGVLLLCELSTRWRCRKAKSSSREYLLPTLFWF